MAMLQVGGTSKTTIAAAAEAILAIVSIPVADTVKEAALKTLRVLAQSSSPAHVTITNNKFTNSDAAVASQASHVHNNVFDGSYEDD